MHDIINNVYKCYISRIHSESECNQLKTDYIEFARLNSSADAIHASIVNAAVVMAAKVQC